MHIYIVNASDYTYTCRPIYTTVYTRYVYDINEYIYAYKVCLYPYIDGKKRCKRGT